MWLKHRDSPAFIYATLLHSGTWLAASLQSTDPVHVKSKKHMRTDITTPVLPTEQELIWLRGTTICTINKDLSDPDLMKPENTHKFESLIAAISTLASYEFSYGDHALQRLHLEGLVRLIKLRGGLALIDSLQQRFYYMVVRIVLIIAKIGRCCDDSSELVASASCLRDVLRAPAEEMGCQDLDTLVDNIDLSD